MRSRPQDIAQSSPNPTKEPSPYLRLGMAVLAPAVALALSLQFPPIHTGAPFMFFFLAVTISALYGGLIASILTIIFSCLAVNLWLMPPLGVLAINQVQLTQLIGFLIVSTVISWLVYRVNHARRLLHGQSESLRVTLASIGDAVIATDVQGKVTWMNAVAAKLTGWESEEAAGRPLAEVFHIVNEQTRQPAPNPVTLVLAEGRIVGLANHTVLLAKDGTETPIDDSAAPILDGAGQILGVVLIFHDVSERRVRELVLEATEARLQMALNAGRMVVWEWDVQGNGMWTTENFGEIYGAPPVEMVAQGVQLLHPDDLEHHQLVTRRAIADGGYHLEFRIIRPDNGETVWLEEWGYSVPRAEGEPLRKMVGISVDITERKQAEEAVRMLNAQLAHRVQQLQALFDLALVGIAVAEDPECKVVHGNKTMAEWLGVPPDSNMTASAGSGNTLPYRYRLMENGEEVVGDKLPMERAIEAKQSIINQEIEIVRADGVQMMMVASVRPLFDEAGEVTGCVSTYVDITERKAAELALRDVNETLERRVQERTAELEEINRELVQFTYVVSHDLRSPLRAITTLSEWIDEEAGDVLPHRTKDHLIKMRQRIGRMEKLLNDLVAYTRAGRVRYREEQVNGTLLVEDVVNLLDAPPGFTITVLEPMPVMVTEGVPLETTLRNLVGNAIKHHHQPSRGHVVISARDLGQWVEFTVRDNGPGIAPEYQERIFGVYQTLRPRDEVEGSGMGLAIAKRLVEGRGGHLAVHSRLGEGCIFSFTWPKQSV